LYGRATTHRQSFVGWIRSTWERGEKTPLFVDEIRTPVDVEDLARALVQLADRRVSGLWHAGGDVLSRQAMGEILADVWGVGRDLIQPTRLADSSYPAPRPAQVALDASSLETRLGWKFRSFRQAVSEQQGRWTMNT
jgi:dTDP-4-dehydrorhamnose reductase